MNLYSVGYYLSNWCVYVFAPTRNRAKAMVAELYGEEYIHMRCKTLRKGVNVAVPSVVDSEDDEAYKDVLKCGYRYMTEEEVDREEWLWV